MADGQDNASGTQGATGDGGAAGSGQKTETTKQNYTLQEAQAEADRRVSEAQKKWRADQSELLAAKDKDAETKITELKTKADEAERYGAFVDAAIPSGVTDLKAAYVVAKELGYFKGGKLDIQEFKKNHPAFFVPAGARNSANAGAGAGQTTAAGGMNAFIRQRAGRAG